MRYEKYVTVGDYTETTTYEGTPQEISELIKLEKPKSDFISNITVHINGENIANKVKVEIEKGLEKLRNYC